MRHIGQHIVTLLLYLLGMTGEGASKWARVVKSTQNQLLLHIHSFCGTRSLPCEIFKAQ